MAFLKVTSPHTHSPVSTSTVMKTVILATLPGAIALFAFFGWGLLANLLIAIIACLGFEALALKVRHRKISFYIKDYSAMLTAVLLALALPPYAPWWLIIVGSFFSIIVAKQLYGGLGYNPFNPAMVGYVVLLISFPVEMTRWAAPAGLLSSDLPSIIETIKLALDLSNTELMDAYTGATPLDLVKQNSSYTLETLYNNSAIFAQGDWAGKGWEWVNVGFLLGGVYLLYKKIFTWHAPIAMLIAIVILSVLFYDGGSSSSNGSPLLHLFSGATMLGAFFIVTDPVSSAVSKRGRIIYGAGIGVLTYIIRAWGNYPDALAFSVLLMNFSAPFIDYYTQPRTYGHNRKSPTR